MKRWKKEMNMLRRGRFVFLLLMLVLVLSACAKKNVTEAEPVAEPEPTVVEAVAEPPVIRVEKTAAPEPVAAPGPVIRAVELETIYFAYDSHRLTEDARRILAANAALLHKDAEKRIVIEGHCDERGSDSYNLALGERRARAARAYLETLGVSPQRCTVVSYGEERPAAFGQNEKSWSRNRRVEFR